MHLLLFAGVLGFGFPIYDSGDDAFMAYLLHGGFGVEPTHLLHYAGVIHPLLGFLVKQTALLFPGLNAYSVWLYAGFFLSFTSLLILLLRSKPSLFAVMFYICLFAVFGVDILLRPTFTNLALMLSFTACMHLYRIHAEPAFSGRQLVLPWLFFTASVLFRLPAFLVCLLPVSFMLFPLTSVQKMRLVICSLAFAVTVAAVYFSQVMMYSANISGWKEQNQYRDTYFSLVNRSLVKQASGELFCLSFRASHALFWEKKVISEADLALLKQPLGADALDRLFDGERWKWLLLNHKPAWIFSCFLLLTALLCLPRRLFYAVLFGLLLLQVISMALIFKLPPYVLPFLLFFFCFVCLYDMIPLRGKVRLLFLSGSAFAGLYALHHAWNLDSQGREKNTELKEKTAELMQHPKALFIATDDLFPLGDFYAFDHPEAFLLKNFLNKDRLITEQFSFSLSRYLAESPNRAVYFIGEMSPDFLDCAMPAGFQAVPDSGFRANSVFAIRP